MEKIDSYTKRGIVLVEYSPTMSAGISLMLRRADFAVAPVASPNEIGQVLGDLIGRAGLMERAAHAVVFGGHDKNTDQGDALEHLRSQLHDTRFLQYGGTLVTYATINGANDAPSGIVRIHSGHIDMLPDVLNALPTELE